LQWVEKACRRKSPGSAGRPSGSALPGYLEIRV
jgi:hypothetical protein